MTIAPSPWLRAVATALLLAHSLGADQGPGIGGRGSDSSVAGAGHSLGGPRLTSGVTRLVPVVSVAGPTGDTIQSATPAFLVQSAGFAASASVTTTLQISTRLDFTGPLLYEASDTGEIVRFSLPRPLPERTTIYWRARAHSSAGEDAVSEVAGPRQTPSWLTLVSPNGPNGTTVQSRRPTFVWTSASVTSPPGPWIYDITITNVATGQELSARQLLDTTLTGFELESNTSYRWSVLARLPSGDSTRVNSLATFVIISADAPLATLLYQNFPNPFPNGGVSATCIWFDLREGGPVRLDVYTLRGDHVRRLIPSGVVPSPLAAGRYGREAVGTATGSGCDSRFTWDGTADDGRRVQPGVYLLRLRADGIESVKKIVYLGA